MVKIKSFDRELAGADIMTREGISIDMLYKLGIPIKEAAPKGKRNCEDNYEIKLPLKYKAWPANGIKWDYKTEWLVGTVDPDSCFYLGLTDYVFPPISLTHMYSDLSDFIARTAFNTRMARAGICGIDTKPALEYPHMSEWEADALDTFYLCVQNEIALITCNLLQISWMPRATLLCNAYEYAHMPGPAINRIKNSVPYNVDADICKKYKKSDPKQKGHTHFSDISESIALEITRLLLAYKLVTLKPSLKGKSIKKDAESRILALSDNELSNLPVVLGLRHPSYEPDLQLCAWCRWLGYPCSSVTYAVANDSLKNITVYTQRIYGSLLGKPMPDYSGNSVVEQLRGVFKSINKLVIDFV